MTVKADGINLGAPDADRARHLKEIIENVLEDTDGSLTADNRKWIVWLFMYICWHEGDSATTRTQTGGGPGRGLMQFEPLTLKDLLDNYVGDSAARIKNLAAAAGVSEDEMKAALQAFRQSAQAGNNAWPTADPAQKVEQWLLRFDSFGVKLMRYHFRRESGHQFPPKSAADRTSNPQDEKFKAEFSEQWANWWKKQFRKTNDETAAQVRARKKREFEARARTLDSIPKPSPGSPPVPPPPTTDRPEPRPPTPRGGCLPLTVLIVPLAGAGLVLAS